MDKEILKKKLHGQIDAMDDELSLQMQHDAALEYGKAEDVRDKLTSEQSERLKKSLNSHRMTVPYHMKRQKEE